MAKTPTGFVSLKSVTQGTPDAATALADIRQMNQDIGKRTEEFAMPSIAQGTPSTDEEFRAIRRIYFKTAARRSRTMWHTRSSC